MSKFKPSQITTTAVLVIGLYVADTYKALIGKANSSGGSASSSW